eukprot:4808223-Alexandrium_andersonii.AAC.1
MERAIHSTKEKVSKGGKIDSSVNNKHFNWELARLNTVLNAEKYEDCFQKKQNFWMTDDNNDGVVLHYSDYAFAYLCSSIHSGGVVELMEYEKPLLLDFLLAEMEKLESNEKELLQKSPLYRLHKSYESMKT